MIEAVKTTVVLFGIFAGLGAAIDKLLLPSHKKYLFNMMQDFWFYLEDLKLHKLPSKAAEAFLHAKKLIVGEKLVSLPGIARAIAFSLFLTTVMFFVGQSTAIIIPQLYDPNGVSLDIWNCSASHGLSSYTISTAYGSTQQILYSTSLRYSAQYSW